MTLSWWRWTDEFVWKRQQEDEEGGRRTRNQPGPITPAAIRWKSTTVIDFGVHEMGPGSFGLQQRQQRRFKPGQNSTQRHGRWRYTDGAVSHSASFFRLPGPIVRFRGLSTGNQEVEDGHQLFRRIGSTRCQDVVDVTHTVDTTTAPFDHCRVRYLISSEQFLCSGYVLRWCTVRFNWAKFGLHSTSIDYSVDRNLFDVLERWSIRIWYCGRFFGRRQQFTLLPASAAAQDEGETQAFRQLDGSQPDD